MTTPQKYLGRKAAKATVRHSVRGTVSKARREPPRTITLLSVGAILGAVGGWLVGRRSAPDPQPLPAYAAQPGPQPQPQAQAA